MAETTNDSPTGATTAATSSMPAIAADLDTSGRADFGNVESFSPSGAPHQTTDIDVGHPAVDANPRANTTVQMNRIDFNDPVKTGAEIAAPGAEAPKTKA